MKKIILIILAIVATSYGYSQSAKKVQGSIANKYTSYSNPVQIEYKAYVYEGSGQYEYRWRIKGQEYGDPSTSNTFSLDINCSALERPECTIFCEITDTATNKKIILKKTHVIEMCN
jgi:hypothetical protein